MATPQQAYQSPLLWFEAFEPWQQAVDAHWPDARLQDLGNPTGLRSYFQMDEPPGQREVARWHKSRREGWVRDAGRSSAAATAQQQQAAAG